MEKLRIQPIIICGGSGSRLWPLSRESFPKQFLNLIGKNKKSFLQQTFLRLNNLKNIENPIIVCNEQHRFIVAEQLREIGIKPKSIILESEGRNTAPAIAIGAIKSKEYLEDSVLLVLPADHSIKDEQKFIEIMESGYKSAIEGRLVTFGVTPSLPQTGYGYIESFKQLSDKNSSSKIVRFIEKPNLDLANKLILDKRYSWNSGIFMFKASQIISEFNKHFPEILQFCTNSLKNSKKDLDFLRLDSKYFLKCPNISIDNAIMEKTSNGSVFLLDVGWSDIGSWEALWQNDQKDHSGNVIRGNVIVDNVKNCYLRSEDRIIACLDVEDLIIIENNDSILITQKSSSQKVKSLVQELNKRGLREGKLHRKVYRPWGTYISIADDDRWQVKKIEVKPKASLSLQMHHHRSEHWIIVSGTALVEIDEKKQLYSENQSVYIPLGSKHRLSNPGKLHLTLIEVQSGSYLGEDDIHRFQDEYGR